MTRISFGPIRQRAAALLGFSRTGDFRFPVFSKVDDVGIARYVSADAIRWMSVAINRFDQADSREGRRTIIEALYRELAAKGIRYVVEPYHPNSAAQIIRTPGELIEHPKEGTCLDLTLLFCGLCLGSGLLPIVVITRGHAFAVVSLSEPLDKWNAFGREGAHALLDRPLKEAGPLVALVNDGHYVAIECTGFAQSSRLEAANDNSFPETVGRTNGRLSFSTACAAGRAQLDLPERPLEYAVDIAAAHFGWNVTPFPVPQAPHQISNERVYAFARLFGLMALAAIAVMFLWFQYSESTEAKANRLERLILADLGIEELGATFDQFDWLTKEAVRKRLSGRLASVQTSSDRREQLRLAGERSRAHLWLAHYQESVPLGGLDIPVNTVDAQTRSILIHDMVRSAISIDSIIECLESKSVGAWELHALLLVSGDYDLATSAESNRRTRILTAAKALFKSHDHPAVHAAAWWVLNNRMGAEGVAAARELSEELRKLGPKRLLGKEPGSLHWYVEPKAGITLVYIPVDQRFVMGNDAIQDDASRFGGDVILLPRPHAVQIPRSLVVSMTEVTEKHFKASGLDVSEKPHGEEFAQASSWEQAVSFCNWLNSDEKQCCYERVKDDNEVYRSAGGWRMMPKPQGHIMLAGYRLPTECEWEFIARGHPEGVRGMSFCFGNDVQLLADYAVFQGYRQSVSVKRPNCFGFFDVHGGLAEWCDDNVRAYEGDEHSGIALDNGVIVDYANDNGKARIVRGGNFLGEDAARTLAVHRRDSSMQRLSSKKTGFRVARTITRFPPDVAEVGRP